MEFSETLDDRKRKATARSFSPLTPIALRADTEGAQRVLEFFTSQISDDHTCEAYLIATRRFADWCASHDLHHLDQVQAFHVAAFVKDL